MLAACLVEVTALDLPFETNFSFLFGFFSFLLGVFFKFSDTMYAWMELI